MEPPSRGGQITPVKYWTATQFLLVQELLKWNENSYKSEVQWSDDYVLQYN